MLCISLSKERHAGDLDFSETVWHNSIKSSPEYGREKTSQCHWIQSIRVHQSNISWSWCHGREFLSSDQSTFDWHHVGMTNLQNHNFLEIIVRGINYSPNVLNPILIILSALRTMRLTNTGRCRVFKLQLISNKKSRSMQKSMHALHAWHANFCKPFHTNCIQRLLTSHRNTRFFFKKLL